MGLWKRSVVGHHYIEHNITQLGYYKYQIIENNMLDFLFLLSGCEKIFFCL